MRERLRKVWKKHGRRRLNDESMIFEPERSR
jgi:hypothetical protein